MLFPKETDLSELKRVVKLAILDKWGKKAPKNLRSPFIDGNEKDYDGYADHIAVKATSDRKPGLVNREGEKIIDEEEFYSGCYAIATIAAFAYGGKGTPFPPGVSFGLRNVMKIKEGAPFEGGSSPDEDFEDVDPDELDVPEGEELDDGLDEDEGEELDDGLDEDEDEGEDGDEDEDEDEDEGEDDDF